jgi:hypothetical protein
MPLHPRNLGRKVGLRVASHPCPRRGERTKAVPRNQDWRSRTVPGFLALERRPSRLRFADLEETLRVEQASKAIRTIEKSGCRFSPAFLTNRMRESVRRAASCYSGVACQKISCPTSNLCEPRWPKLEKRRSEAKFPSARFWRSITASSPVLAIARSPIATLPRMPKSLRCAPRQK